MNPIYVAIPTIGTKEYIFDITHQLNLQNEFEELFILNNTGDTRSNIWGLEDPIVTVLNTAGDNLYKQWNIGLDMAMFADDNPLLAILNDDIIVGPNFLSKLAIPFEDPDVWAVSANYGVEEISDEPLVWQHFPGTFKDNGFAGFAFMVRPKEFGEYDIRFEEQYSIWHGDDDMLCQIYHKQKKTAMARSAVVHHIDGGSNSFGDRCRLVNEENAKDSEIYYRKWHNG